MRKNILLLFFLIINSLFSYANVDKLSHLEDAFNRILYSEKNNEFWKSADLIQEISVKYSSNNFAEITVDGYSGNFILNVWKAKLELLIQNWDNAMVICSNALKFDIFQGINTAPERISELFLIMNTADNKGKNEIDVEKTEYWKNAIEFDKQNTLLLQNKLLQECYDELKENKVDEAAQTIQYALKIPAPFFFDGYQVYLAILIEQQNLEEFFDLILECLRKVPGKQAIPTVNLAFQLLQNVDLTDEQLEDLCYELEKISARFPATEKNIDKIVSAKQFLQSNYISSEKLFNKALNMPLEETNKQLREYINKNVYNREKAFLILGEKFVESGNTNKAIEIWLEGLGKENIINLNKLGGEPLVKILDNNISAFNKVQKNKYLKIFQQQIKRLQLIIEKIKNSDQEIQYNTYTTLPDKLEKLKEKYGALKQQLKK